MTNTANSEHEAPRRGRPPRETADQTERRRRDDHAGDAMQGYRLSVNTDLLDFERFSYRWIKDVLARIHAKTKKDDWDIVKQDGGAVKDDAEMDAAVFHVAGVHPDGRPQRLYLCRKPIKYYNADRAEKIAELDRQRASLVAGRSRDGGMLDGVDYVPNEGIRI